MNKINKLVVSIQIKSAALIFRSYLKLLINLIFYFRIKKIINKPIFVHLKRKLGHAVYKSDHFKILSKICVKIHKKL